MQCLQKILFLLLLQLMAPPAAAQLLRLKHTDFKELNAMPNRLVKCMAEDGNGILWAASENTLQWFDGSRFHDVPYGNGPHQVPGLAFTQLYRSPENELWIFYNNGFSVYKSFTHSFTHYTNFLPGNGAAPVLLLAYTKNELVLHARNQLYYVNRANKQLARTENGGGLLYNSFGYTINNNVLYKLDSSIIYIQQPGSHESVATKRPEPLIHFSFHLFSNSIALYATDHYLSFYDALSGRILKTILYPGNKYLQAYRHPSNIVQKDRRTVLALLDDELWEIDLLQMEFTKKLSSLTGHNFIANGYFKNALYDSRGNLWVTSNLHGLLKIAGRSQPVQLIGPGNEAQHFVKCFTVNKAANLILAGTYGKGLMLYDTLGNFIRNFPLSEHGEGAVVTSIARLDEERYLVFIHGDEQQYIVHSKSMTVTASSGHGLNPGYYAEMQELGNGAYFYPNAPGILKIAWKNNALMIGELPPNEIKNILRRPVIKARVTDLSLFGNDPYFTNCIKAVGLQQTGIQMLAQRNNHWLFGSIKGIFEFDTAGKLLHTYNIQSGLADDYIYAMLIDNNNDIWCSHNKGLSRIDSRGHVFNLTKEDGLQSDEFNYGAAEKTADGQLFFGGVKGLNAFYPHQLSSILDTARLLITRISSNDNILPADTAFWNVKSIKLPFENNQIKISLSAIGNNTGTYYNYQYRVRGLDYEWKDLGHTQEINLALPSGNYSLEMAVAHTFDPAAKAQKTIIIEIVPPYYQRWWFITMAILISLGVLALVLQAINKNKYRKKLEFIKMQQELEAERQRISRDLHDNMGAYTTALLANVEKFRLQEGENEELLKMKNNADNILHSLRETIWVLNNKEISVADFSDAFKTYCIKALQNFENIGFEAGEIIDDNKTMTAAEAIHFDKILKEAFQNILKHSHATRIYFTVISNSSLQFSLADNGRGYDTDAKAKGNGLENMRWRAMESAAVLTIESTEGKGSIITIKK